MRILELNITEFGCFKNKTVELDAGLNLVYGENESGKSTLLLFIKFMLYGMTRRTSTNSERERSISWSGHCASGSMTFEHGGYKYRIERSFVETARSGNEKLNIVCLDNGLTVNTDRSAGEFFLGVVREAFESSACIGQMRSTDINGEKVAASIENMLASADESVDTARVLKALDAVRVGYRHKSKSGGSLFEGEQKINSLRLRAEKAKEAALSLDEWEEKLDRAKRDIEIARADFEQKDALLAELNKVSVIKRFEKLGQIKDELAVLNEKKEESDAALTYDGALIDRAHTAELKLCAKNLIEAQKAEKTKKDNLDAVSEITYDAEAAAIGEKIESAGGPYAVEHELAAAKKRAKRDGVFAILTAIGTVMLGIDGAVLVALMGLYGAICFIGVPILLALCIVFAVARGKAKKKVKQIAAQYDSTPDALCEKLALCGAELSKKRAHDESVRQSGVELEYAERDVSAKREALGDVLSKTLSEHDSSIEAAAAEFKRIEALIASREEILRECAALQKMISAEQDALAHYDQEALRAEISVNIDEVTPTAIAEAERTRGFLAEKLRVLTNKISGIENTVISLRATAEDPLPISDELAELEAAQARDVEFYDALTLAMETVERAADAMRGNFTPEISRRAGELLGNLSDGKYGILRTTSTLGVSLDKDGYSIKSELLSAGTRDVAYLALRLAIFTKIFNGESSPLILDESLCQLDEKRAERALRMLVGFCTEGVQGILFTSHKREGQILDAAGLDYKAILL